MSAGKYKKSTVAAAAAAIVLLVAAAVIALIYFIGGSDNIEASDRAVLYRKSDGVYLSAAGEKVKISLADDANAIITDNSEYLIYTTHSAKVNEKYDIYICDLTSKSKVKRGPVMLDYGVESAFSCDAGERLYYSKQDEQTLAINSFCYDFDEEKSANIDFGVGEFFVPKAGGNIFYSKKFGEDTALYSYSMESGKRELLKPIKQARLFDGTDPVLLYESASYNEGESELYSVKPGQNPLQLATMVSHVFYNEYEPGGNLYFLVKKDTPTDWRGIIEDDMESADKLIKEPDRDDYTFFFGVSIQYSLDLEEYKDKLLRDEIRAALDETVSKKIVGESYTLYANSAEGTAKLADGVEKDNVFAVRRSGSPRAVVISTQISASLYRMSDLFTLSERSGTQGAVDTALSYVEDCVVKTGHVLVGSTFTRPAELGDYSGTEAQFLLPENRDAVFALVKNGDNYRLMLHAVAGSASAEQLEAGAVRFLLMSDGLWYLTSDGNLCRISDKGETIEKDVSSFTAFGEDGLIVMKSFASQNGQETADIYIWSGSKLDKAAENVNVGSLTQSGNGLAFIRDDSESGGELCIYAGGKLAKTDDEVFTILAY